MSDVFVLPVFPERDYDAFRGEVDPALPDFYEMWRGAFGDMAAAAVRKGHVIIEVEVRFNEFIAYCRTNRRKADPDSLYSFVLFTKDRWKL